MRIPLLLDVSPEHLNSPCPTPFPLVASMGLPSNTIAENALGTIVSFESRPFPSHVVDRQPGLAFAASCPWVERVRAGEKLVGSIRNLTELQSGYGEDSGQHKRRAER